MNTINENYEFLPGSNGNFYGKLLEENRLQDTITSCPDCYSIHQANKSRTEYDLYWIKFYNNKAQHHNTNLTNLQFLR